MALSNYSEDRLLKANYGNTAPALPTAWYLALHSGDPGETGSANELTAGGYARKVWTPVAVSGGTTSNDAAIVFAAATENWSEITYVSVWDAVTAGNMLDYHTIAVPRTILNTGVLTFATGELDITYD